MDLKPFAYSDRAPCIRISIDSDPGYESVYRYSSASLRLMLASCAKRNSANPGRNVEITKSNPAP